MPSTVKVRIKAARNLSISASNNSSSTSTTATSSTPPSSKTSSLRNSGGSSSSEQHPDTHVTITLGGHSAVAEYNEDEPTILSSGTTAYNNSTANNTANNERFATNNNNSNNEGGGGTKRTSRCYSARTRTVRRSSHPSYNQEFRFEVADDTLLQDEPLLFHVWHTVGTAAGATNSSSSSTNNSGKSSYSIGLVYLDLNPLLMRSAMIDEVGEETTAGEENDANSTTTNANNNNNSSSGGSGVGGGSSKSSNTNSSATKTGNGGGGGGTTTSSGGGEVDRTPGVIDGWFPLYDTLGGVRGELGLSIKLNFIGDVNPFRDSSAGVQLFPFSKLDGNSGYTVAHVFGFVEELVVADDPEFEWSDNFNQARASHETRQTLMYLLDAKVRRRMCKKVLEMGGNAVLGYYQNFDMEGDSGLVARTYGTCVLIEKKEIVDIASSESRHQRRINATTAGSEDDDEEEDDVEDGRALVSTNTPRQDMTRSTGMILTMMSEATAAAARQRESAQEEVQLLTMKDFGPRVRVRIGGLVTARSVKFLGKLASKLSDQETRDGWWSELRDEIRSHARSLCCTQVIGYTESSTIHDDVCILSITGTAATVRGLPDLAQAQRMWAEWEVRQHEIISRVERRKRHQRIRNSYPGDSSPGSVISTNIQTPFSEAVSDGDEKAMGSQSDADPQKGQMHMKGSMKQIPFSGKATKQAKLERNAQRLERRLRRMGVGKKKNKRAVSRGSDMDKSAFVSDVLLRARLGRPCSYCHVPYHHRLAPFQNMKLVPCLLCGKKWVPEIILATVEPPARLPVRGSGVFIQARVCRVRPRATGESDALAVSEVSTLQCPCEYCKVGS